MQKYQSIKHKNWSDTGITPSIKPGVCEYLVPSYRGMMEQRAESEFAALSAAGAIALVGTGYFVGGKLTKIGIALIGTAGGASVAVPAFSGIISDNTETTTGRKINSNKTLVVSMEAYQMTTGDDK